VYCFIFAWSSDNKEGNPLLCPNKCGVHVSTKSFQRISAEGQNIAIILQFRKSKKTEDISLFGLLEIIRNWKLLKEPK
jgi:hypothetical protein